MGDLDNKGDTATHGPLQPDTRLESLVNALGGVVWEFDWNTGAFTFVSDAVVALLGYSKEEWLTPGFWTSHIHVDDAEWAQRYCIDCTREGRDHDFEYRMVAADGRVVWLREIVTVDKERRLDGCLRGLMIDVTARKAAEERLAASDARFREMATNVGMLAVQIDAAGIIVYANEPVERLLGTSVVGRIFFDLLDGPAKDAARAAFEQRVVTGGTSEPFETPLTGSDGLTHIVRWNSANTYGPRGEFAGIASIGEDITARVAHEREITRKAEEFDAIFRLSRDLFFRVDTAGRIVGYNAGDDPLYAPPEVFLDRAYRDVLPPNVAAVMADGVQSCHATARVVTREYELEVAGEPREWEARFLPLQGGDTTIIVRDVTEHNARDLRLRESEERYRMLVELSPVAIYVVGLDDVVLYCNEAAAELLGADGADQLTGRSIAHLLPDDYVVAACEDEARVADEVARMAPGDPAPVSPSMRGSTLTLDGRKIDIERTIAGVLYEGRPALLVLARDITEELEAHRAVEESRDFLATLLEMLDSGVIVVEGASRTISRANRPAEVLLGYGPGEMVGMSTRTIHPTEESYTHFNEGVIDSLQHLGVHATEIRLARRDGTLFDAEVSVRVLAAGPEGRRLGIIRDITDRKQADRMLRDSEQRFRAIIEQAPFGMHFYRLDGDELLYENSNEAAQRILGVDLSAHRGRPISQVFPGLDDTEVPEIYRRIAREGGSWHTEQITYDSGGISGAFEVTAFQIQPGRMVAMFRDITERKVAEEREQRYLQRLSALAAELADVEDEERRRLAEDLHDRVSQALAVAMMHLRAADGPQGCDAEELGQGLSLLETAIRETRTITTELFPPVLHELGLPAALRWLGEETERQYRLPCAVDAETSGERQLSEQARGVVFRAVRELLINAVKHAQASRVSVTYCEDGRGVEVIVEDDGVGFDVERVVVGGGSGFGLFSIRERLPHMGGSVEVDSAPGKGTRVTVQMPWEAK